MPNDSFSLVTLEASGTSDVAFSPDEHFLYVALKNGDIDVFDAVTRQKLTTWHIGHPIGAISVSPDGSFLLVTGTAAGQSTLYQVSTGDGSFQTYTLPGQPFWDVEIVNGTRAIVTGGQNEVQLFDLATHSFSPLTNGVYYQNSQIVLVEDSRYTLMAEPGISSGPLALYDNVLNAVVARGTTYQSSNTGFNWGTQAVSEAAGIVIQFIYYGTINVYDLNLVYQKTVNFGEPIDGLVFDDNGEFAYVYLANTGFLAKYETTGWTQVEKFNVGTAQWSNDMGYGNQILVANNGKYLTFLNDDSAIGTLKFIDLTARDEAYTGTSGADALAGGKGDDFYLIDNAGDTILENPYEGKDSAEASVDFTLPAEVEDLTLTGAAVLGAGNALNNRIYGNGGANILDGAGGNDVLVGGAGADIMTGGLGNDRFYVDDAGDVVNEAAGEGSDRLSASVSYVLAAGAEVEVIEADTVGAIDLTGSDSANTIYGNDNVNVLRGQSGNDVLWGFGGDDVLVGGAGIDAMWGGLGNDIYYVDDSGDVVNEAAGAGSDRIATGVSYVLPTGSEIERVEAVNLAATTALDLTGSSSDNSLYGNDGVNILRGEGGNDTLAGFGGDDFLVGGAGADAMSGGQGNDTYYVDHAGDVAFEAAGEGNDRLATSVSYALSNNSEIERLEAVTITVTTALDLTGSDGANTISGNNGVNILRGEGGNDTLSGFAGDDFLIGGAGADIMIGGTGSDTYYVDDAGDVVVEAAGEGSNDRIAASTSYALASNSEIERLEAVTIAATTAFDLTGSDSSNIVSGNEGVNILRGEGGNDFLSGYGGDDHLVGGAGADIMTGGLGNDTYYVDAAGDSVNEASGEGSDRVVAAASYTLAVGAEVETLEAVTRSATNAMDLAGSNTANAIFGNDGANVLNGRGGSDVLWGHGGADTFAFTTALGAGNVDRIADFVSGTDKIALDDAIFGAFTANAFVAGTAAQDADDRIVYNQATGQLFFDADGNGAGAAILFATLDSQPALAATDFTVI